MKTFSRKNILLAALLVLPGTAALAQLPYQDASLSFHERAVDLVSRLTLAEKAQQMGNMVDVAIDRADASGEGRVVIPAYQYWNEALHGVARSGAATSFPESKGMSASWDRQLIYDCAAVISDEARVYNNLYGKGLNYWCPTINMARDPRWGRDEENYGEDPFLAGQLAVQFIKAMQGDDPKYLKTVACAKHFAANNYEQGRQGSTSYMKEHNLREYYLPAFEMAVKDGGVMSIMSSYNALSTDISETNAAGVKFGDAAAKGKAWGGKPNAMNDWLLTGILRNEWGFQGYVTSDCAGVSCIYRNVKHCYYGPNDDGSELQDDYKARATADAIKAGNDMNCEFKNTASVFQTAVEAAISKGYMTEADLDQALIRVLETRFMLGEFDGSSATQWSSLGASDLESEAHQSMALKAARESIVLLKNEKAADAAAPLLPLSTAQSVALIGPYANQIMLGDYSGTPTYTTTPFQAVSQKMNFTLNDGTYSFTAYSRLGVARRGEDSFKGSDVVENTSNGDWIVFNEIDFGAGCANFTVNCATKSGKGEGSVNFYLDLDDADIATATEATAALSVSNSSVAAGGWTSYADVTATVDPTVFKGKHKVTIKFISDQTYVGNWKTFRFYNEGAEPLETQGPVFMLQTSATVNETASDDMIARAVAVAQKADVVVFLGGTNYEKKDNHATGTESHDRFVITLPGNQQALLEALYAVNKNVVLVLESNSSMDITWAKANIPAIVEAWYGGQAQGQAICDVLYGDYNPSGKLTSTWYNSLSELPAASDSRFGADGMLEYDIDDWGYTYMYYGKGTGANVARQAAAPLYPFGYGLSYTTFEYSNATISSTEARCTVTNTGSRSGAEVVQVYVSFPGSSVEHMQKLNRRLVGFERVELAAGESREVVIPIHEKQLAYWKEDVDQWWVEGGTVNVYISASSADDRLSGSFATTAHQVVEQTPGQTDPEPQEPDVTVSGIAIPTATDSYISWSEATVTGATVENNGANIGSTGKNTVATFTIGNSTKQDYVLTFATGSKNEARLLLTLTNTATGSVVLSKNVTVENTGSWTPSKLHSFYLSQLPKGTYELKFQVVEAASYAGNWGQLAFRSTSSYDQAPGSLTLTKGSFSGSIRTENDGANVGWVKRGDAASHPFICTEAGVYTLGVNICWFQNAGSMTCSVVDAESGATEATATLDIASKLDDVSLLLGGELTAGLKTLRIDFESKSDGFLFNYKDLTLTRSGDHYAQVKTVSIDGLETTTAEGCDWFIQLPAASDVATTFSVSAPNATVTATAEGCDITDNGDGTFTIPTPAPGTTTLVSLTLTPASGAASGQTVYTLKLFRIGDISLTDVTVDGVSADVLSELNDQLTATYQNVYTALPEVKVMCVDGNWFSPTAEPTVADGKATYSFHVTMAGKEKDYTLIVDGIHIYNKVESDRTVELRYTAAGTDKSQKVWTNGLYSLSPVGDGWENSGFKLSKNDGPFTLQVPVDIRVKQFIIREFSDNYAAGSLESITSEGMTAAYIPAKHDFQNGTRYDLVVNLEGHQAGQPITFAFSGGSQTTGWYELTTETVAVASAPVLKGQSVTPTTDKNHCVVALSFDREMTATQATIGSQTVSAEGGSATLYFPVWNLDYDTSYTFTIAAGAAKDSHGNANAEAIEIPVSVGAKAMVEQKPFDYVVANAEELKAAIAAIDATNTSSSAERKVIFLKNGIYDLGGNSAANTVQWVNAHNISLIGESKEGVVICGTSRDISNPVLNIRYGSGQYMQDLTVRNLLDFDSRDRVGVSVAVYGGNKAVFKNVAMQAQQDTQVTGERAYHVGCDFYGAVDFICGGGDNYYDRCNFYITNPGYVTAPSTSTANKWGYVMQQCTIDKYVGSYTYEADGKFFLGRPWQNEPRNYWLNTTMNVRPTDAAWGGMGTLPTHFYEYNSLDAEGQAIDLSVRQNSSTSTNSYTPVLTADEAARFTVENVLGGTDSWLPTEMTIETAAPQVSVSGSTLSWTAVEDARCYVVFWDGQYLANVVDTHFEADQEGIYTVRSANSCGGLGRASESVVVKRSIVANQWSTIVLPVAVSDVQQTFGSGAQVARLVSETDGVMQFESVAAMNANEPYLIQTAADFESAVVGESVPQWMADAAKTVGDVTFQGVYQQQTVPEGAYFLSGGSLYRAADATNSIRPLRAFFAYSGSNPARSLSFVVDGQTTGIRLQDAAGRQDATIYDLSGRRLSDSRLQPGMYIVGGKKMIRK